CPYHYILVNVAFLACLSFNSLAQTIPDSKLTSLADNEQWLDLLHFHQIGFIPRFESQVDDDSFFIAPDGKYSPKSELKANIAAFTGDSSNLELICQFPAR
ncbi:hypothetical protein, partial [Oleiphilus sp. HI0123]